MTIIGMLAVAECCDVVTPVTGNCSVDLRLSGLLGAGVFVLEIHTPSTSMPLSIALTPNGTSGPLGRLRLKARFISCCLSFFCAARAVCFRSWKCLCMSFVHPAKMVRTYHC